MAAKKPKLYMLGLDGGVRDFIRKNAESGNFPNFKRLLDKGCLFTDCMTVYPSITPTCWASISTGTVPSRHGAVDQELRLPGGNPNEFWTGYDSHKIKAERFWETIVRQGGKALVMEYATSGPPKVDGVLQVSSFPEAKGPIMLPMDKMIGGHLSEYGNVYVIPTQCYEISYDKVENENISNDLRFQTPSGPWQPLHFDDSFVNQDINDTNVYTLPAVYTGRYAERCKVLPFEWKATIFEDGVSISYDGCEEPMFIRAGEWTDYIERELQSSDGSAYQYTFRIKLLHFDFEKRTFGLYVPLAVPKRLYAWPEEFGKEIEKLSVIPDHAATGRIVLPEPDVDTYIELQEMNTEYHRTVIESTLNSRDIDVVVEVIGNPDGINHAFKSIFERVTDEGEFMYEKSVELYNRAYKVIDDYLGYVLDNFIGDETTFFVVSDHGAMGFDTIIRPHDILEKAGLLTWLPGGNYDNPLVDWSRTKAYPMYSGHIFLNLKGREPNGIVEPEDYDKVVNEVIIALQEGLRDNGEVALAFAVENSQAGFVGQGGEGSGDVVYGLTGGRIGGYIGGVHACQIPSARDEKCGDIRSVCIMKGPKIKEGVVIDRPMDLTDIAPTVMFSAGYPQPADATGGIVFQAFRDGADVFTK